MSTRCCLIGLYCRVDGHRVTCRNEVEQVFFFVDAKFLFDITQVKFHGAV